jgi:hypothetical protein
LKRLAAQMKNCIIMKATKIFLATLVFTITLSFGAFAQDSTKVDTATLKSYIKMLLLQDPQNQRTFKNFNHIQHFLQMPLEIEFLKSKGFGELIFIKVPEQPFYVDTSFVRNTKLIHTYPLKTYSEYPNNFYVIACNKYMNTFYRIIGFKQNDFEEIYDDVTFFQSGRVPKSEITVSSIQQYLDRNTIEGVNLECLLLSLLQKKTECYKD